MFYKGQPPLQSTLILICALLVALTHHHSDNNNFVHGVKPHCAQLFNPDALQSGQSETCNRTGLENSFKNVPILNAVYCFNNGTGICKALAGRFEFYFNSWSGEVLRPAQEGKGADAYGYYSQRVPLTYTVDGDVLFADRPINWAIDFTKSQGIKYNLLSSTSFNWCKYAVTNNWPYKSAIQDHDVNTTIYFFNRQACIFKKNAKDPLQHFNTRFLGNSKWRLDLDYNPTIFAMEDNLAKEVRLVKHHRQHWIEVPWKTVENLKNTNIRYFVQMGREEVTPCKINSKSPRLIPATGYKSFAPNACISDYFTSRASEDSNARLMPSHCGLDRVEIADYLHMDPTEEKMFEVGLHNIPRWPNRTQKFYGVTVRDDTEWEKFAKDGFSFSATTTIEINKSTYRVLSLFSTYQGGNKPDLDYDEDYPETYLADYTSKLNEEKDWVPIERESKKEKRKNLNYVDDIAYLHKCETVLIIHGPLYTEISPNDFTKDTASTLGSINRLGAYEPVNAFFAKAGEDKLYFYHRLNYVSEHTYTCASGDNKLVTANAVKSYYYRHGKTSLSWMQLGGSIDDLDISEESNFKYLNVFKGSETLNRAAPDPTNFEWIADKETVVETKSMPNWIFALIVLGTLTVLIMFILGFIQIKRRVRRRQLLQTVRSEMPDSGVVSGTGAPTNRSGLSRSGRNSRSNSRTIRSARSHSGTKNKAGQTIRSAGLAGGVSNKSGSNKSSATVRSGPVPPGGVSWPSSGTPTIRSAAVTGNRMSRATIATNQSSRASRSSQGSQGSQGSRGSQKSQRSQKGQASSRRMKRI